ncbi:putative cytochrome P450 superfamily [Helianthus annuus]|uniref:Cytochrome P450 superfamily n=3 Tax=Helianthus annuus TaxID=4232 RepID=A0A9K3JIK7_HELAN|nr:putative cytochrome P450 superfamily [Helianthus annuus]KAJ0609502.1 putative cytochrome P450 superfamily [Helianthus annuus]KAJ0775281.1 putative cytochrome P450 superfamily [Helianthus annuus]KAJ0937435.1 putative cytochrome P450 superfamily [Helianthus annuus]KAJ0945390.1 putative cytochrome P450 superfamily [Helianthus annuus]
MIFDLTAKKLISYNLEKSSENLRENFDDFMMGLVSIPLAIPGTAHHKCLKKVMKVLKNMLEERRAKPSVRTFCTLNLFVFDHCKIKMHL